MWQQRQAARSDGLTRDKRRHDERRKTCLFDKKTFHETVAPEVWISGSSVGTTPTMRLKKKIDRSRAQSHPTVGVARFGQKDFDQLGSLIEELSAGMKSFFPYIRFGTSAYRCRSGGTNDIFSSVVSGEILRS